MKDTDSSILTAAEARPTSRTQHALESGLYRARWMLSPMYIGLCVGLILPVWMFCYELYHLLADIKHLDSSDVILGVLELIDLTFLANLVLIVVYSGYANFVSKLDIDDDSPKDDWKTKVDFSALKMKLIASMVAISGIQLLKGFMRIDEMTTRDIIALIALHLVFVVSGVLLALMDYLSAKSKTIKTH